MAYNVAFISLGCAKNQVNCEQMMAAAQAAGNTVQAGPEGADVVVVNTCGFLASACEEAIENILEMAELKKAGKVRKILVSGCMAQRYQKDILQELPEVDGILGTGSYGDIAQAIDEVMAAAGGEYCAPISGSNQQSVQLVDLDGDGEEEAIVFAKTSDEKPLKAYVFDKLDGAYQVPRTVE